MFRYSPRLCVICTSCFPLQCYFTFFFNSILTSSSNSSSSSTVLSVLFKKSTTAASYFAGCFRRCCTWADPENLGELWSRIREISFATLSRRIWRPPFSAFQALHFRGTFEGGSSRSWSRGRVPPPPCVDGNGPGQSGPPKHPVHLLLWITGILILTNQLQAIGFYIIKIFPFMQNFG